MAFAVNALRLFSDIDPARALCTDLHERPEVVSIPAPNKNSHENAQKSP
jgi:hypothetical protein